MIKGEIDTSKYLLENTGMVFLVNDTIRSSSVSVDYKIGKTYKVYVENDKTNNCTTKITFPPAEYVWEPGPEDGNYYSEDDEIPLQQYQDANEIKSYRDALTSGSIASLAGSPKLSDRELDDAMDEIVDSELDRFVLPITSIAIDYERDTLVLWMPDLTIGNKVQAVIDDVSFVLLYEEAPARWTHDGPEPQPQIASEKLDESCRTNQALCQPLITDKIPVEDICGSGTEYVEGICQVVKTEKTKTVGDDAPFFGIFAYLDNLISWVWGK